MKEYISCVRSGFPVAHGHALVDAEQQAAWLGATTCDGFNVFHAAFLSGNAGSYGRLMSQMKQSRLHGKAQV